MIKMRHLLLSLGLVLSVASAQAQLTTSQGTRSDDIQLKLHKVELLVEIMPLALSKDQFNKLFPTIEKVRMEQKKVLAAEDAELLKLEPGIDAALKGAYEKGEFPKLELMGSISKTMKALGIHRQVVMGTLADDFYEQVKGIFNKGQMTIMAKSAHDKSKDDSKTDDKAKAEQEVTDTKNFIKAIFLDPVAYDLLLQLSKTAN